MSVLHPHHTEPLAQPAATQPVPRTRSVAARVAICAAAVIVIELIVLLLAQNTRPFLSTYATTSLAVALLITAVAGILLTLRRLTRRHHH